MSGREDARKRRREINSKTERGENVRKRWNLRKWEMSKKNRTIIIWRKKNRGGVRRKEREINKKEWKEGMR